MNWPEALYHTVLVLCITAIVITALAALAAHFKEDKK